MRRLLNCITFSVLFVPMLAAFSTTTTRSSVYRNSPLLYSSSSSRRITLYAKKSKSITSNNKRKGEFWEAQMVDVWRPTINDVERISWGKPAKKKGTGSRGVPHRLNEEERFLFEQARRKGFLEVDGSGWRSQRREAPLLNTYRSLCDARGQAVVVLHKGSTGMDDNLVVDLSPLRTPESFDQIATKCLDHCEGGEIIRQPDGSVEDGYDDDNDDAEGSDVEEITQQWETRPIYQLPHYCILWELERSQAKVLGKVMSELFDTSEKGKTTSKKPIGVKPGKSRRHGGYGIG